jgi:aminobenzoyl-glutamate utilization protein B
MSRALPAVCLFCLACLPARPAAPPAGNGQDASRLDALKAEAVAEVEALSTLTQQMVDQVFSYAELGFQEVESSRYLTEILEKHGFSVERGVAGIPTAWVATWGSGKPAIGFISDVDCIPQASQKPGVAYHAPMVPGAPGHGEGHNSGNPVNVTAAIALKKLMEKHRIGGTIKLYPGIAEELLAVKAFFVRAGLFKDLDVMLGCHVGSEFSTPWGPRNTGLVSVEYTFKGLSAHSAGAPWRGKSALDAVELMNMAWNLKREHLRPQHRVHYVITNGGDQPNVVPPLATVWYFLRETDYARIKELYEMSDRFAQAAAMMTDTTWTKRLVGSAWPTHFSKPVAEVQQKNIDRVGMPSWTEEDQALARAVQKEIGAKVDGLLTKVKKPEGPSEPSAGTDDIGDISWVVPTVYMRYPANIPNLPGHNWVDAIAMATPIAHKGATAGAKVQAMTALDYLLSPDLVAQAWDYFTNVQTKDVKYVPLIAPEDRPAIELNREKMGKFKPLLRPFYYDPTRYKTYLEQLGIRYPTLR